MAPQILSHIESGGTYVANFTYAQQKILKISFPSGTLQTIKCQNQPKLQVNVPIKQWYLISEQTSGDCIGYSQEIKNVKMAEQFNIFTNPI